MTRETSFEWVSLETLIPYARNARTHTPEQIDKVASSIKEFGFLNPVIISQDDGILAGHCRVMAAKKLGLKTVPCVRETFLTDAQKRAYILADNRLALDAGWDEELLRVELGELQDLDFNLDVMGFSEEELDALLLAEIPAQIENDETVDDESPQSQLVFNVTCETRDELERLKELTGADDNSCQASVLLEYIKQ